MNPKVLSAVAVDVQRTELWEIEMPEIPPDAGLLKLEAAGVCGSDWPAYSQKPSGPRILGHENVGTIAKIGAVARKRWGAQEGDRVALEEYLPCGHCPTCRTGEFRLCDATDPWMGGIRYGSTPVAIPPSLWGGYSQYQYLHPNSVLHKVPDRVPAVEAALALPLGNGIEWACMEAEVCPGKTVVIQGPGQQGLGCVLAAKVAGADCVIVSGLSADRNRLELARKLGADHTVDVQREDLRSRVIEITGNKMADVVIDVSSGGPATVISAVELLRKRGVLILAGKKHQAIPEFDSDRLIQKYVTLKGVRGHGYSSVELALQWIASGKYPLGEMCTHQYALREVDDALKTTGGAGSPGAIHVTVLPWR
jgi:threonine dehydrogenase-like Zn-dependent dehydrogenase